MTPEDILFWCVSAVLCWLLFGDTFLKLVRFFFFLIGALLGGGVFLLITLEIFKSLTRHL